VNISKAAAADLGDPSPPALRPKSPLAGKPSAPRLDLWYCRPLKPRDFVWVELRGVIVMFRILIGALSLSLMSFSPASALPLLTGGASIRTAKLPLLETVHYQRHYHGNYYHRPDYVYHPVSTPYPRYACTPWCPYDCNPCDPVSFKLADGRCSRFR
jgi:hypothetical protein